MQVNILEAKNRLSQLIKSAQAGEDVVIANRGAPVARLVPAGRPDAEVGSADGISAWLKDHPLPDYLQRSAKEIEAAVQAEREAWD